MKTLRTLKRDSARVRRGILEDGREFHDEAVREHFAAGKQTSDEKRRKRNLLVFCGALSVIVIVAVSLLAVYIPGLGDADDGTHYFGTGGASEPVSVEQFFTDLETVDFDFTGFRVYLATRDYYPDTGRTKYYSIGMVDDTELGGQRYSIFVVTDEEAYDWHILFGQEYENYAEIEGYPVNYWMGVDDLSFDGCEVYRVNVRCRIVTDKDVAAINYEGYCFDGVPTVEEILGAVLAN